MPFVRSKQHGFLCSSFVCPGTGATAGSCHRVRSAKLKYGTLKVQLFQQLHHSLVSTTPTRQSSRAMLYYGLNQSFRHNGSDSL